jgi:hypothetical protein
LRITWLVHALERLRHFGVGDPRLVREQVNQLRVGVRQAG